MKMFITAVALLLVTGCVTTSQSKSDYQAEIAGLKAENAALEQTLRTEELISRRVDEAMAQISEMLKLWSAERRPHSPKP